MKPSSASKLLAALTAEHTALVNFVALLEHEQTVLVENQTDQLIELSEQKSTAAVELSELAQTRHSLLQENIPQLSVDSIQTWLKAHNPEGLAIWQKSLDLIKQSHQLNRLNGELIQMKLRHNQQSLTVLSNAVNKVNLYGPDGQTNFTPGSGRSLGSG